MGFKKDKKVLDALIAEFKRVKLIHANRESLPSSQ